MTTVLSASESSVERAEGGIRAVLVGFGIHGRNALRLAVGAGVRVVAVVDPAAAGTTLSPGETGTEHGVTVVADLPSAGLGPGHADVALLCLRADVDSLLDLELACIALGLNVLTIVETVFDLEALDPDRRREVDQAARAAGVTVVATGSQDVTWAGLVRHVSAQVRDLRTIRLTLRNGVDGYPREFLDTLGIGLDVGGFTALLGVPEQEPSIAGATALIALRQLGLSPTSVTRRHEPVVIDTDRPSKTYERTIAAGDAVGDRDITVIGTAEGVEFVAVLESTAYAPGERDSLQLQIEADPSLELAQRVTVPPSTVDATMINRIDDVIAAVPGLVSALDLRPASYTHVLRR